MYQDEHSAGSVLIVPQLVTSVILAGQIFPAEGGHSVKWFHRRQVFIHGMAKICN